MDTSNIQNVLYLAIKLILMTSKLREKNIPVLKTQQTKIVDFRTVPINFNHKLSNEDYVDIREMELSGINHYFKSNNPPYYISIKGATEKLLLRKSIVLKLVKINKKLNKNGLELYFFDCYRPIKVQQFLYNIWLPQYLKKLHPNYSQDEISRELNFYSAKPPLSENDIDRNAPPPHTTGAAMDVTLRFKDTKEFLFMGTIFDESTTLVHTDYFELKRKKSLLTISEEEALKNRRILYHSMKEEGIENYPFEWWHFSWGDQMWAILSDNNEAFYSNLIL